jgi:hypothetical protein
MHEPSTEELLENAPAEEYAGPAVVSTDATSSQEIPVDVQLRGHFEPLDGRFHWYGRIAANAELAEQVPSGATVTLTTSHGTAEGRVSDIDPWGRFRIAGTGRPPF